MAFGWKTIGNSINPSAVGPQNKNPQATYEKPRVYGLAKFGAPPPPTETETISPWWYAVGGAGVGALLVYLLTR